MSAKRTPGPWKYRLGYEEVTAGIYQIATVVPCGEDAKTHANGHTLAAAPDLLEALEALLAHVEWRRRVEREITGDTDVTHRCHAAIAKAKGTQ